MPLNVNTYLTSQGWKGAGAPLDGVGGRGLKKPLSIPQKSSLTGVGKDRDRATEWWDSIFSAGAKNLNIGSSSKSTSEGSTPTPEQKVIVTTTTTTTTISGISLASLAKREHAKKTLMSNFIRGEVLSSQEPSSEPNPSTSNKKDEENSRSKADRKAAKQAKKLAKVEKAARKAEKALRKEAKKAKKELKAMLPNYKDEKKKSMREAEVLAEQVKSQADKPSKAVKAIKQSNKPKKKRITDGKRKTKKD